MISNKKMTVLFYIVIILAGLLTITSIVLEATGVIVNNAPIRILFAILIPVIYIIASLIALYLLIQKNTSKSLRLENQYNLGRDNGFYNYYAFQKKLKFLSLINGKHKPAHIIAFTATKQIIMHNMARNDAITQFNGYISDFLHDYLTVKSPFNPNESAYCFYHGIFLIYEFSGEERAREIIDTIQQNMFDIAKEKELRVFVQPFFGVAKVDLEAPLIQNVEHAVAARNNSEQRFEGISFYSTSIDRSINMTEVEEIKQGLENNEFVVYYQPKFSLITKEFCGAEALVRWNSRTRGFLSPSKFMETAEASGLVSNIDEFVFRRVCEDLFNARKKGRRVLPVSVNFSAFEFYDTNFVKRIVEVIDEYRLPHDLIQIEVTETTSRANNFLAETIVEQLGKRGLKVLMDDFGMGYSNIGNFIKMKFHIIKIDKSYIDKIDDDPKTRELLKFLINLAKINDMEVVAEGVDSQSQVDFLRKAKCDVIQGYFYSKPISKVDYEKFLQNNPFEKKDKGGK